MIDDEKIIEMFFERSEQGMRELDIKYGKVCHKLSYHIVGNRWDAEECVNDAYLGAWNAIPPARPNPLLSYLVKIVRNISLKIYWRKEAAKRSSLHQHVARIRDLLLGDLLSVADGIDFFGRDQHLGNVVLKVVVADFSLDILFDLPLLATDCADDIPLFLNLAHRSANN